MLHLITGRSGSGKTHEVYSRMRCLLEKDSGARVYLLVPEQASFENEKQLLTAFGDALSQRVHVLSFTRMSEIVFRDIGGITGTRIDDTVSLLLMSRALAETKDSLQLYSHCADNDRYLQELLQMLHECKQCGVSADTLLETADALAPSILKDKLHDLSLIFSAHDALLAQASLIDPQDDLTRLAKQLPDSHLFDGTQWFVDGFKGFTAQEFAVLETLLSRVSELTVALCSDGAYTLSDPAFDLFSTSNRTAARLRDAAHAQSVPVAAALHLSQNHRTTDAALRHLEAQCYASAFEAYEEAAPAVTVTSCADRQEECVYAARTVRRLLREEGGFCRDFTVVTRDIQAYGGLLESAFEQEGIPYYIDNRDPILTQPLISLVESALAVLNEGWHHTHVLRLCKTGLLGFSPLSTARLENYAFLWNIRGNTWRNPFDKHPDGFASSFDDAASRRLFHLNLLRSRVVEPLKRFQMRLSGNRNGKEFATAVFQLLQDWRVPRMVRFQTARLAAQGDHILSEQYARLWDCLMDVLDKFALALPSSSLSLKQLSSLFHLAISAIDLGTIPQTLDSVLIGRADHIRYKSPKTVIVIGANEGVFPAYPTVGGVLTDRERRRLISAGLPIADDADHRSAEERYYAYMAISACSERLFVTYARQNGSEELFPSTLVETVQNCLPHHTVGTSIASDASDTESVADTFARLTACWNDHSVTEASLRLALKDEAAYTAKLSAAQRTAAELHFDDPAVSRKLFGDRLRLSPTQVDTFYRCQFAYFCKYGLRLKPRKPAELNAAQAGSLAHYVMQTVLPRYVEEQWKGCDENRIKQNTAEAVAHYVAERLGGLESSNARLENLLLQLTELSAALLWRVVQELRSSRFVPIDYELPIGRLDENGDGIAPWILKTADGATVQVQGTVDRVDICKQEGTSYIRVIDYKTGNKDFNLSEVLEGLNLQMLIYLFSINQDQQRYGGTTPAGVLYLPAKLPVVQVSRELSDEEIESTRLATMRMNGLLLDNPEVLDSMEADIAGIFIPASKTKKGALSATSSVASLEQFGRLQKRVADLLTQMAEALHRGEAAAVPRATKQEDACRYCDYRDICRHEPNDPTHTIVSRSLKAALQDLSDDEKEVPDDV